MLPFAVAPIGAQSLQLTVVITDSAKHTPINGALVELSSGVGGAHRAISSDSGRAVFRALSPGFFSLRVKRIGYTSLGKPVTLTPAPMRQTVPLALAFVPATLSTFDVTAEERCSQASSREALALWDDIRVALAANAIAQHDGTSLLRVTEFEREVRGRTERSEERIVGVHEVTGAPFVTEPPDTIATRGFVYPVDEDALHFVAPDAELLVSDAFVAAHCFTKAVGVDSLEGLAFAPDRNHRQPDISGTLWVARATRELRSLDFSYTRIGHGLDGYGLGGHAAFARIGNTWIVSDWYLRMPHLVARANAHDAALSALQTGVNAASFVRGTWERGGRATLLGSAAGVQNAVVTGVVFDSIAGRPLPGAVIRVLGAADSVMTDAEGVFRLSLPPAGGRTTLLLAHEKGAFLQDSGRFEVGLESRKEQELDIAIPSIMTLVARMCPRTLADSASVTGLARDSSGRIVADAEVRARWNAGTRIVREEVTRTGSHGEFALCGLPAGVSLNIRALTPLTDARVISPGGPGEVIVLEPRAHRWMDLTIHR